MKKGISLIVLVITIIVMIILAATIILTINNNNVVDKAKDAVEETNFKQVQEVAQAAWAEAYVLGTREQPKLEDAVLDALNEEKIDTSPYIILVTTKGVTILLREYEKNAYGFYFDVPYVFENESGANIAIITTADGSGALYVSNMLEEYGAKGTLSYSDHAITAGTITLEVSENGTEITIPAGAFENETEIVCTVANHKNVNPHYNKPYEGQVMINNTLTTVDYVFGENGVVAGYADGILADLQWLKQSEFPYFLTFNQEQLVIPKEVTNMDSDAIFAATTKTAEGLKFGSKYYSDTDATVYTIYAEDGSTTGSTSAPANTYRYTPYFVYSGEEFIGALSYNGKYMTKADGSTYTGKVKTIVDILPEQTVAFTYGSDFDSYTATLSGTGKLVAGQTYFVEWDGVKYTCTARDISYKLNSQYIQSASLANAIGNAKTLKYFFSVAATTTEAATSEPFLINYSSSFAFKTASTAATHVVRIYQEVEM